MVYVDTSVLVPLFLNEPYSVAAADWYAREKSELVAAAWCIPEFASTLGIKQRTGAIDAQQAQGAWTRFERMVVAEFNDRYTAPCSPGWPAGTDPLLSFALEGSRPTLAGFPDLRPPQT
jgi:hypothetical protein